MPNRFNNIKTLAHNAGLLAKQHIGNDISGNPIYDDHCFVWAEDTYNKSLDFIIINGQLKLDFKILGLQFLFDPLPDFSEYSEYLDTPSYVDDICEEIIITSAENDSDNAIQKNFVGFNKLDTYDGHILADYINSSKDNIATIYYSGLLNDNDNDLHDCDEDLDCDICHKLRKKFKSKIRYMAMKYAKQNSTTVEFFLGF
ncbi:MAG: hypothetical protein DRQ48_03885 [Gammaproteobacteria bacterium]|nr:MAG: hypothetical protein DRQ48_03885 [Gammaproteobacteria bacterium]